MVGKIVISERPATEFDVGTRLPTSRLSRQEASGLRQQLEEINRAQALNRQSRHPEKKGLVRDLLAYVQTHTEDFAALIADPPDPTSGLMDPALTEKVAQRIADIKSLQLSGLLSEDLEQQLAAELVELNKLQLAG